MGFPSLAKFAYIKCEMNFNNILRKYVVGAMVLSSRFNFLSKLEYEARAQLKKLCHWDIIMIQPRVDLALVYGPSSHPVGSSPTWPRPTPVKRLQGHKLSYCLWSGTIITMIYEFVYYLPSIVRWLHDIWTLCLFPRWCVLDLGQCYDSYEAEGGKLHILIANVKIT